MFKQIGYRVIITIAIVFLMAVGNTYAQTVEIPNPSWPLETVIRTSVHQYTVPGDRNYAKPSNFTWQVYGGRLFLDSDTLTMAGDGTTATVTGDSSNVTHLWVIWDAFPQPSYKGYVYVTELSADGCERSDSDKGKFRGMNMIVIAPPDVRFLTQQTNTCSNEDGIVVDIEIKGVPPINLKYSINGEIRSWDITKNDLFDSDMNGQKDNLQIVVNDFTGTTVFKKYEFVLLESSSEGIIGRVMPNYPTHTVNVYVQPGAPVIDPSPTEVTVSRTHQYSLIGDGSNIATCYWELYAPNGSLSYQTETTAPTVPIQFTYPLGIYKLVCYYLDKDGCISLPDTLPIMVFDHPTIAFADSSKNTSGCSALSDVANDSFEFTVEYYGATSYDFKYAVYDYNNVLVNEKLLDFQTNRSVTISIPNNFINYELPEINRQWKVVIVNSMNEEQEVVRVIDGNIVGGRDERTITIHPKPLINEGIDFAN